ncbi:hypothetical protein [Pedosphaera parvula]|uniref:Uncharacterized protein n=1 Tax=Pedosphaera parvula (strain Ellin514) TaxID=320771 RepID=B9XAB5_PEDPL|nr:hypothetical protein [Pedosphaera parvula]EEF63456.1 conserved hypothetical protein [Pedosphaera parvula Ellin514]
MFTPLPLDDPRWFLLQHAYGDASQESSAPSCWSAKSGFGDFSTMPSIMDCLRSLQANPEPQSDHGVEPWNTLFSSLCHQGTIYSASFAAVPHILEIGLQAAEKGEIDIGFLLLPTLIEQSRLEGGQPETPAEIYETYLASLPCIHELAYAMSADSWNQHQTALVAAAMAVAQGHLQLSKCLLELGDPNVPGRFLEWFFSQ